MTLSKKIKYSIKQELRYNGYAFMQHNIQNTAPGSLIAFMKNSTNLIFSYANTDLYIAELKYETIANNTNRPMVYTPIRLFNIILSSVKYNKAKIEINASISVTIQLPRYYLNADEVLTVELIKLPSPLEKDWAYFVIKPLKNITAYNKSNKLFTFSNLFLIGKYSEKDPKLNDTKNGQRLKSEVDEKGSLVSCADMIINLHNNKTSFGTWSLKKENPSFVDLSKESIILPFIHINSDEISPFFNMEWSKEIEVLIEDLMPNKFGNELKDTIITNMQTNNNIKNLLHCYPDFPLMIFLSIDSWNYDPFEFNSVTNGCCLLFTAYAIFTKLGFISKLNINKNKLLKFLSRIQAGYYPNPYHNSMHAADVAQATYYILIHGGLKDIFKFTDIQCFAIILAAITHDYGHPGLNNKFHSQIKAPLSICYNNISILENYHISATLNILNQDEYNILENFNSDEISEIKEILVEAILSTDIQRHNEFFSNFKNIDQYQTNISFESSNLSMTEQISLKDIYKEQSLNAIKLCIKSADISNSTRSFHLFIEWTDRICRELWNQGDLESQLGLPLLSFMNRKIESKGVAEFEINFIQYFVKPLYDILAKLCPEMKFIESYLTANINYWNELKHLPDV